MFVSDSLKKCDTSRDMLCKDSFNFMVSRQFSQKVHNTRKPSWYCNIKLGSSITCGMFSLKTLVFTTILQKRFRNTIETEFQVPQKLGHTFGTSSPPSCRFRSALWNSLASSEKGKNGFNAWDMRFSCFAANHLPLQSKKSQRSETNFLRSVSFQFNSMLSHLPMQRNTEPPRSIPSLLQLCATSSSSFCRIDCPGALVEVRPATRQALDLILSICNQAGQVY